MKHFKKAKKRYNILAILLLILASIALVVGICLDFLAEIDSVISTVIFAVALCLIVLIIPVIIFIARIQSKIAKNIVAELNKNLDMEYTYQGGESILDIVDESMHPYDKDTSIYSKDGIVGNYEDISFEYYLCVLQKEPLFSKDNFYELYVFKNASVFSKEFFVTAKKMKNVEDFHILPTHGGASIYTRKQDEICDEDLPKGISFLSVSGQTLYVYKFTERKKPLFQLANDEDNFKQIFLQEVEKIKMTYEETKAWVK